MTKGKIKAVAALALVLSLGTGAITTHAASVSGTAASKQKIEQKLNKHGACKNSVYLVLKDKLGFTDAQIADAEKSGKTAFDLAKTKGVTEEQLKTMILDAEAKLIDDAVVRGKLTKEKADLIKANFKTKIQNWDGSLKHDRNRDGHFNIVNSVLKDKLGFTDAQIADAEKSGKTAFDLAKTKGITEDQLKTMIIDAQSKAIDNAVKNGKLTKEKADSIKADLKTKMQNWDGRLGHKKSYK